MGVFERETLVQRIDLAEEAEFELGGMRVDPGSLTVSMNGQRRELQPRVMQVLIALARASPTVVSRDRLAELCWGGRVVGDDALNRCVLALRHLAQEFAPEPFAIDTVPRVGHRLVERGARRAAEGRFNRRAWAIIAAVVAFALAAAAIFLIHSNERLNTPGSLTWMVTPAASDQASQALSDDLVMKLAGLNESGVTTLRLISGSESSSEQPDFTLVVRQEPGSARAALILKAGPTQSIMWSQQFEHPSNNLSDLKQQVTFAAASAFRCTLDGLGSEEPLAEQTLRIYLNACVLLADQQDDVRRIVPLLAEVVRRSPQFVDGWAKLLTAESDAVANPVYPEGASLRPALARHIVAARKLDSDLPEAYLAELQFVPPNDFLRASRLLDTAVARHPDHAGARAHRSMFLQSVGRMNDALGDAGHARKLDPLSPSIRDGYITTLAVAGRLDAALDELDRADKLWPGASSLVNARYRVHLRFGDAREALQLIRSGAWRQPVPMVHEPFAEARVDPSPAKIAKAVRFAENLIREDPRTILNYSQTLAEFDRKEELLRTLLNWRRMDIAFYVTGVLFRPAFEDLHRDVRFMQVAKHFNLIRYWQQTGKWPDFCFRPDFPYDCKVEANKVDRRISRGSSRYMRSLSR